MRPPKQLLSDAPSMVGNTSAATHGRSGNATGGGSNPWGPFGNAASYAADMAIAVGILLSGFVVVVLLMLGVRFYLRRRRGARGHPIQKPEQRGGGAEGERPLEPPTVYRAGKTELAGAAAAECAICLTEFADGDRLLVLPACRHGFHVECAERWLASSSASSPSPASRRAAAPSCPVCRASWLPPERSPEPEP